MVLMNMAGEKVTCVGFHTASVAWLDKNNGMRFNTWQHLFDHIIVSLQISSSMFKTQQFATEDRWCQWQLNPWSAIAYNGIMFKDFHFDGNSASAFLEQLELQKEFIPHLNEVCSRNVLSIHWIKDDDMDDDAYNHLERAWDEVQLFDFDLDWLKPSVKSP
ncbi:hypothetical protein V8G54_031374 [Vigna mungo]|uniref:Uncharacterized protein n=1 Tax=Vigna mungo TaxID=3915 RepID=A0AAQ3RNT3_VIGMU